MYYKGAGVPRDKGTIVQLLREAAEKGHWDAQVWLGELYSRGDGVERDPEPALKWYRVAAEEGYPDAQVRLGLIYERVEAHMTRSQ